MKSFDVNVDKVIICDILVGFRKICDFTVQW